MKKKDKKPEQVLNTLVVPGQFAGSWIHEHLCVWVCFLTLLQLSGTDPLSRSSEESSILVWMQRSHKVGRVIKQALSGKI